MHPLFWLLDTLLALYGLGLLIYIIVYWLIYFRIINAYQPLVSVVMRGLSRILEPALRYIRKILPQPEGIDFSPIVLFIAIEFARYCLRYYTF